MTNLNAKLALIKPAMTVAGAIASNLPENLAVDPEGLDPSVVQANEMAWRLGRTLHAWLCASIQDPVMWPEPPAGISRLDLLNASAGLAAGIVANYSDELPLDVSTADPKIIQQNAAVWRVWRTIYAWLALSLADDTLWAVAPDLGDSEAPTGARAPSVLLDELKGLLGSALATEALDLVKSKLMGG